MDRITLKDALETDAWLMVYAGEPSREISVDMRYKDLVGIRKLIVRYCEEKEDRKEEWQINSSKTGMKHSLMQF